MGGGRGREEEEGEGLHAVVVVIEELGLEVAELGGGGGGVLRLGSFARPTVHRFLAAASSPEKMETSWVGRKM